MDKYSEYRTARGTTERSPSRLGRRMHTFQVSTGPESRCSAACQKVLHSARNRLRHHQDFTWCDMEKNDMRKMLLMR